MCCTAFQSLININMQCNFTCTVKKVYGNCSSLYPIPISFFTFRTSQLLMSFQPWFKTFNRLIHHRSLCLVIGLLKTAFILAWFRCIVHYARAIIVISYYILFLVFIVINCFLLWLVLRLNSWYTQVKPDVWAEIHCVILDVKLTVFFLILGSSYSLLLHCPVLLSSTWPSNSKHLAFLRTHWSKNDSLVVQPDNFTDRTCEIVPNQKFIFVNINFQNL